MMKLAVSQFCSFRWSMFQDVVNYAKHGFNSVGLWRKKIDEFGLYQTIDLLAEMEISVASLHWAGGFTGSGGSSYIEAIEDAKTAIQDAHLLQAGCLIVHPGARNGHTDSHLRRIITGAFDELVPFAEDYGVRLSIEPCLGQPSNDWNFLKGLDQQLDFIAGYSAKNLGLALDLYHVGDQQTVLKQLNSFKDRIALVQLSDFRYRISSEENRCHLGDGIVPIQSWLQELAKIEYDGYLELELHGFDVETYSYDEIIGRSRNFLTSLPQSKTLVFSEH